MISEKYVLRETKRFTSLHQSWPFAFPSIYENLFSFGRFGNLSVDPPLSNHECISFRHSSIAFHHSRSLYCTETTTSAPDLNNENEFLPALHFQSGIPKCTENHKEIEPQIRLYELALALDKMSEIKVPYPWHWLVERRLSSIEAVYSRSVSAGITLNIWPFDGSAIF